MRKIFIILGIPIDDLSMEETLEQIETFVDQGRRTGKGLQIVTVNVDFAINASKDNELRAILQEADLSTADGMPLVWGGRLLGVPIKERVAGADLVPQLAARAAQKGYSLFLLGAKPGVAAKAAEILQARNPGLQIAGVLSPPFTSVQEMDIKIVDEINQARPDILLVAFGNPKQEKWIRMNRSRLKVPVMMGVGGSLDFIAGTSRRAPGWMQKTGLEWIYRLLQEPRRLWRRYGVDLTMFSTLFARQWWIMRQGRLSESLILPHTDLVLVDDTALLRVKGRLTIANYSAFRQLVDDALKVTNAIVINMNDVDFIDSAAIGALVDATKRARQVEGEVCLVSLQPMVKRTLAMLKLDSFLTICEDQTTGLNFLRQRMRGDTTIKHDLVKS